MHHFCICMRKSANKFLVMGFPESYYLFVLRKAGIFMKYSFSTLGCPDLSMEDVISFAGALGYDGLEIRGIEGEMRADRIAAFRPGVQRDTIRRMQDAGLSFVCFGSSTRFDSPDTLEEYMDEGKAAIDVSYALGIPYVRVFGDNIPSDEDEDRIIDSVIEGEKKLCEYAEGSGVGILQEVHGSFNRLDRILRVVNGVDHPKHGIVWDVAHSDKMVQDDYLSFYFPLKDKVHHVHFKDQIRSKGYQLCSCGEGDIPLREILRTLSDDGYAGFVSLEWEKKWHPELPSYESEFPHFLALMHQYLP